MIIRKIKPEEVKRCEELFAISFEFPYEKEEAEVVRYEQLMSHKYSRQDQFCLEKWAAFEDDNETMMSYFGAVPYPINFDGHQCMMSGIGGVATLPPYRRRGGIRKCFEAALKNMYETGMSFSYLYPFSTAYYRKFGYELSVQKINYQVQLSFLPTYDLDGTLTLLDCHTNKKESIIEIDKSWQSHYNMMVICESYEYHWLDHLNPYKAQEFTYLYETKEGIPKAYVTFQKKDDSSGRNLHCSRFVFVDAEGIKGLFSLFKSMSSDHMHLFFDVPEDKLLYHILPEWAMGNIIRTQLPYGMARVINVEKVLRMATYIGSGECNIKIIDPYIIENNHCFSLQFKDNCCSDVRTTNEAPDIELSIADFSKLIIGTMNLTEHLFAIPNAPVLNLTLLNKIFYRKPCYISEYF